MSNVTTRRLRGETEGPCACNRKIFTGLLSALAAVRVDSLAGVASLARLRMKKVIATSDAPAAVGPYSQAVSAGDLLFCAGQIPLDPVTGALVEGDVTAQTTRVLENVRAVLAASEMTFANVVKTTVFLTDLADFAAMNTVYANYFAEPFPARSTVQVAALPRGASVEIEVTACR
jgi:2-iminobutanoate/2-iminopropanoate deaminase